MRSKNSFSEKNAKFLKFFLCLFLHCIFSLLWYFAEWSNWSQKKIFTNSHSQKYGRKHAIHKDYIMMRMQSYSYFTIQ